MRGVNHWIACDLGGILRSYHRVSYSLPRPHCFFVCLLFLLSVLGFRSQEDEEQPEARSSTPALDTPSNSTGNPSSASAAASLPTPSSYSSGNEVYRGGLWIIAYNG